MNPANDSRTYSALTEERYVDQEVSELGSAEARHSHFDTFDRGVDPIDGTAFENPLDESIRVANTNNVAAEATRNFSGGYSPTRGIIQRGKARYLLYCDGDRVYAAPVTKKGFGNPIYLGDNILDVIDGIEQLSPHNERVSDRPTLADIAVDMPHMLSGRGGFSSRDLAVSA